MFNCKNNDPFSECKYIEKTVNVPIELYESSLGKYFIGYADELQFGMGTSAWARLYNPPNSGVNLYVNVWTVTDISEYPFRAQFWFNANPPQGPFDTNAVTPSNTAIRPVPISKVQLQSASLVSGEPTEGIKAFVRRGQPEITLVESENGKLIFPPGGSFMVFLSLPEYPTAPASGRVAFGWWEEKLSDPCCY